MEKKDPQKRMGRREKKPGLPVGSKGFSRILWVVTIVVIYMLAMVAAIAPGNRKLAGDFLLSQSVLLVLVLFLWYKQIRYMIREKKRFHPLRRIAYWIRWMGRFLTPVHFGFRKMSEADENRRYPFRKFREEYDRFYTEKSTGEHTTQMYRHMLMLHKARLKKMGLTIRSSMTAMQYKNEEPVRVTVISDGKFRHIHAEEYITGYQDYLWQEKKVYSAKRFGSAEYDVIGVMKDPADVSGIRLRCPGCGAVSSVQELLDGCGYCGRKFLIEELKDRLCNMSFAGNPILKQKVAGLRITAVVNWLTFLFALLETGAMTASFYDVLRSSREWSSIPIAVVLLGMTSVFVFILLLAVNHIVLLPVRLLIFWGYRKQRELRDRELQIMKRNQEKMEQIKKKDPDFSLNSFFSNVRNKLSGIHFAVSGKQAEAFSLADLSEYLPGYYDVAGCIFGGIELLNYERQAEYRTAKIRAEVELLHWKKEEQKMEKEKEVLELELRKKDEPDTKNSFGIYSPVCGVCGAPVDLLKGNHCAYCGSSLNSIRFDWCITSYQRMGQESKQV